MSLSAVFTRRFRGVRVINLMGGGLLLVLVLGLYLVKTLAGTERADIATAEVQIADEQRRIRLLQAEVAYLEQPDRIQRLAEQGLAVQPLSGKRETAIDSLPAVAARPAASLPKGPEQP
jgi:hypothetical protein